MFYTTDDNRHGLPHDPFKAIVAPRPIGWISTCDPSGRVNLAPYSFFNAICDQPKLVMFSSVGAKDSVTFAERSGNFVANFVSEHLAKQMNATSVDAPRGESEFEYAGLTPVASTLVSAPRVAEAYAALECRVTQTFVPETLDANAPANAILVVGQVVGIHIDEQILTEGLVDVAKARPVSRLGYLDFATTTTVFSMRRPRWSQG
ncbi:MAG: flavin reductase family protein [Myxococcales bacterium]|nr:flavin reductase family protein [Myxococcales bacterium]MDD9972001.1 flavin reductase family protein [Myxococcales bacterium]